MSISVATGFHRFVRGVRPFRGLQGKPTTVIDRVLGVQSRERDPNLPLTRAETQG